jgi:hypothetical protein
MRALAALVVVCGVFALAAPARAGALGVPKLRLDSYADPVIATALGTDTVAAADPGAVVDAARRYEVPRRYSFAWDESRALWFAAGASAAVSLGAHVLIGLPSLLVAGALIAGFSAANPVVAIPLLVFAGGAYLTLHAVGTGVITALVFNGMSDVYDGSILSSIGGHFAGDMLGATLTSVMFGAGGMLLGGLGGLAGFTGSAGLQTVVVLSVLGALPAVVIAGIALVALPAVLGVWAVAVTASPAQGYATAPDWKRRINEGGATGTPTEGAATEGASSRRTDAQAVPIARVAFELPSAP